MTEQNERRIAIFLDFENLVTNTGISADNFDLQTPMARLLEKGRVIYRRAYADWSRFRDAKGPLHELGVELIDVPPSTRSGKNGADMRLVIDALELCYARGFIDTFVLGSGDSDFCPLAYKLRENDRTVIGLGVRESTSRLFVKACDEFLYLKPKASAKPAESSRRRRSGDKGGEKGGEKQPVSEKEAVPREGGRRGAAKPPAEVPAIARAVASSMLSRATDPINPSLIKETIVRQEPDFDERDYGFSTFSKLLERMEREGLLRRQLQGRQWYVLPPDVGAAAQDGDDEAEAAESEAVPDSVDAPAELPADEKLPE